jgi:glycerophosphoryl diester phosphodiesterase
MRTTRARRAGPGPGVRAGTHRRASMAVALIAATALYACGGDDASRPAASAPSTTPSTAIPPARRTAIVIAHRGASATAPEHTIAAYDRAVAQGADYIEQDIQLTADGELVVMHDETLDRTARGPAEACRGLVRTKTLAQLRRCDVGSWFNDAHPELADPAFVGLRIPTLRQVTERYGDDIGYYIETKAPEVQPGLERALLDLLDEQGLTGPGRRSRPAIVQSFSPASLRLVHARQPDLPLVLLLVVSGNPIAASTLDDAATFATGVGPSSGNADAALVEAAHARCLDVHPYTVDDPAEMTTLLDAGVDGMFTDSPDVLVSRRDRAAPPPEHCR